MLLLGASRYGSLPFPPNCDVFDGAAIGEVAIDFGVVPQIDQSLRRQLVGLKKGLVSGSLLLNGGATGCAQKRRGGNNVLKAHCGELL